MIHHGSYLLMREHFKRRKKIVDAMLNSMEDVSENNELIKMTETRLYIGLNDADTKKQIHETEQYMEQLKEICFTHHVPFSVGIEEGGYFHEDGQYVEEKTLVLSLIDVSKESVLNIADDLCTLFNQESILITEDEIKGEYHR